MGNYAGDVVFHANIYTVETTDPVLGGASGVSNQSPKELADRTAFLKAIADAIGAGLAQSNEPVRISGAEFTVTAGPTYEATAGFIFWDGQIYPSEAFPSASHATNVPVASIVGGNIVFAMGASGSGLFDYDELVALQEIWAPTEWTALTLINGWTGTAFARQRKDGAIEFRGFIDNTAATNVNFAAIPSAMVAGRTASISAANAVDIDSGNEIIVYNRPNTTLLYGETTPADIGYRLNQLVIFTELT